MTSRFWSLLFPGNFISGWFAVLKRQQTLANSIELNIFKLRKQRHRWILRTVQCFLSWGRGREISLYHYFLYPLSILSLLYHFLLHSTYQQILSTLSGKHILNVLISYHFHCHLPITSQLSSLALSICLFSYKNKNNGLESHQKVSKVLFGWWY